MLKKIFITTVFIFLLFNSCFAQLTLIIDSVPHVLNPSSDAVYVAGSFNSWNPADSLFRLVKNKKGKYSISINGSGKIEYKFTKGSWATNETKLNGEQLPNRKYTFKNKADTVHIEIERWAEEIKSTRTSNVFILDSNMYIPQLNRNRRIWIYLPNDYATSNKKYPVMYLQDGQNIFDATTSFSGEWFVDDSLSAMELKGDSGMIVVGIDNGGEFRTNEYVPYNNPKYGGGQGDAYADFIVNTLKPRIDTTYRTKPDRLNTAIGGSSLGAYFALYAGIKFQNVFSKIASISPAYWFDDSLYTFVINTGVKQPMRIYQVCSQNEGESVIYNMWRMQNTLVDAGMFANQMQTIVRSYGAHKESFWQVEFSPCYRWLFSNEVGKFIADFKEDKSVILNANTVTTFLKLNYNFAPNTLAGFRIYDEQYQEIPFDKSTIKQTLNLITINTTYYREGKYTLWLYDNKDKLYVRKFTKK
jgi:predicted alpha/beta superfamily hydrolase